MKYFLLLLLSFTFLYAAGGDTIRYTDDVKNLADGDNFYSDIHYHPLKDSIAAIVNGRLGNINIASDAEIDLSKLDTAGVLRGDTLRNKKVNTDIIIADTAKIVRASVDSLFTGGIKGVELSMDSIFNLTGTAYKVQGLSPSKKLVDMPIYTGDGNNITVGKDTTLPWSSSVRALQIGGTVAIAGSANASGTGDAWIMSNTYHDNLFKPIRDGATSRLTYGVNGLVFYYNSGLTANASFTPTQRWSIDTSGNGRFKKVTVDSIVDNDQTVNTLVYANNNKKFTSGPAYNSGTNTVTVNITGTADSSKKAGTATTLTGSDILSIIDTGSFPCTLTTDCITVQKTGTIKYINIGNHIILSITGALYGISNSVNFYLNIGSIPSSILPDSVTGGSTGPVWNNNHAYPAFYYLHPTYKRIYINWYESASFDTSEIKGINYLSKRTELSYVKH